MSNAEMRDEFFELAGSKMLIKELRGEIERLRNACLMYDRKLHEKDLLIDACQKDAERYRWLRDPCSGAERVIYYSRGDYGKGLLSHIALDAAIDAAIAAMKEQRT